MMGVPASCVVVLTFILYSHSLKIQSTLHVSKSSQENVLNPSKCVSRTNQQQIIANPYNFSVDLRMPGVIPTGSDTYLCMAFPVPTRQDAYIVDFIPLASMDTVHHMLLFGCQTPVSTHSFWDCGSVQGTCEDEAAIMYAWARNAPPTKLPKDVGFKVGRSSGMSYFVLQIHYGDISAFKDHHRDCSGLTLRMTSRPQPFIAGIYLLMSVDTVILPGQRVTDADVACDYTSYPIYPFAFRTHTHRLGKVVSGYRIRDGKWTLIGRQSPQLPQAFYPANKQVTVKYGDTLAARCVFTGEGKTSKTYIGGTSDDEMCNFYIMYYMESRHAIPYMNCMEMGSEELFQHIPPEANVPINVSPSHMNSVMHLGQSTVVLDTNKLETVDQDYHFEQVSAWPQSSLQLGQVSGLALDSDSNLVIFHRGDHHWGADSFNNQARYQQRSLGPIQQSAILVVDPSKGSILKASGRNMFFLPHGITADKENNYWVTDVALHQVLKVSSDGKDKTLMALGEAFIPGSDNNHFCQPTDVAVDTESGNIFVSDGYCNARIIKFSADGKYLSEWGAGSSDRRRRIPFHIPHSLVLLPDKKEICVADRENGRIQCFIAETGEFVKEIKKDEFGGEVFAISYSPTGDGLIFAVNGESLSRPVPIRGFVIDYSTKDILDNFSPNKKEFKMPHDIAETRDGSVFVGDASSKSVYKFTTEKLHHSVKKAGIEVQELEEMDAVVQTKVKQDTSKTAAIQEKQTVVQKTQPQLEADKERKSPAKLNKGERVLPVIITTLLLIPLVVVISIGVFISWRKKNQREVKAEPSSVRGILGKIRGKAVGSLNLGNFFPSHKGYSRQGFDQLSTEGSDQERNDEDSSDSENEEYSALPPPQSSS
ncbi:peptidyl-glycine alpha-amidating monooxygenase isoform X1 [Simochromis diagramma]|uniref:peptidyl-glycine alpha-amidating monooxygenase isoform X1 n=2 Tax=Simochromis diagramma TaxID=43689 RepID=UPI001A7E6803|nr:peptidyl-glycine alpha-amidating monooxygenase isoform X1 [Simochromis diagramma]XP_039904665.1 peptidyl-glycine alpha-amidating monooxygenase isoform X1 [Simochromis diagramma]XP_039904666.1 peptidyl-glycine alpha-amidating monooxygenase isoform X1 [Simochromis diagramma]